MRIAFVLVTLVASLFCEKVLFAAPLKLHAGNPHYFDFRGKPTVLITSGEHYGAVLNLDFDYVAYLDELARFGFNHTRLFAGTYRETPGSFGIKGNTLAPDPKRYAAPWLRSSTPDASDGENKFDLTKWNEDYFKRLKDFVSEAGKRDIVVEITLFCTMYSDELWRASPMNSVNNINRVGMVGRYEVYALKEKALTEAQMSVTRKIIQELNSFDNLYFEAIYLVGSGPTELTLKWPAGNFHVEWLDTLNGSIVKEESFVHAGRSKRLQSPLFAQDIALRLKAE